MSGVYIISGFFFSCIVSGGIFLGLYMFLPETQSSAWYPIAGMMLVSVPWAFWFFTLLYRCFRPNQPPHNSTTMSASPRVAAEPVICQQHPMAALQWSQQPTPYALSLQSGSPLVVAAASDGFNLGRLLFWETREKAMQAQQQRRGIIKNVKRTRLQIALEKAKCL